MARQPQPMQTAMSRTEWPTPDQDTSGSHVKERGMDRQSRWSEKPLVSQVVRPRWVLKTGFHTGKGLVGARVSWTQG